MKNISRLMAALVLAFSFRAYGQTIYADSPNPCGTFQANLSQAEGDLNSSRSFVWRFKHGRLPESYYAAIAKDARDKYNSCQDAIRLHESVQAQNKVIDDARKAFHESPEGIALATANTPVNGRLNIATFTPENFQRIVGTWQYAGTDENKSPYYFSFDKIGDAFRAAIKTGSPSMNGGFSEISIYQIMFSCPSGSYPDQVKTFGFTRYDGKSGQFLNQYPIPYPGQTITVVPNSPIAKTVKRACSRAQ